MAGRTLYLTGGLPLQIQGNNFEFNRGPFDLYNANPAGNTVIAATTGGGRPTQGQSQVGFPTITMITLQVVSHISCTSRSAADVPAYVRSVSLSPQGPVGIGTVALDIIFSRPMAHLGNPLVVFDSVHYGESVPYATGDGLASGRTEAISIDPGQTAWVATDKGLSALSPEGIWRTYNTSNSGLLNNWILDVAMDQEENVWAGVNNNGVAKFAPSGAWTTYTWSNSPLACQQVDAIASDLIGNIWLGCRGTVSELLQTGTWRTYTTANSGLSGRQGTEITVDSRNNVWFGQSGEGQPVGVSKLTPDGQWQAYNTSNSGLVSDYVSSIAEDSQGNIWFGSWNDGISVLSPTGIWSSYSTANSLLLNGSIRDLVSDARGRMWILTEEGLNLLLPDGTWRAFTYVAGNLAGTVSSSAAVYADGNAMWAHRFGRRTHLATKSVCSI